MSLKGFHVVFIVLAVICLVGFCAWSQLTGSAANTPSVQVMGIGSGVLGLVLAAYGVWFIAKKSRRLIV